MICDDRLNVFWDIFGVTRAGSMAAMERPLTPETTRQTMIQRSDRLDRADRAAPRDGCSCDRAASFAPPRLLGQPRAQLLDSHRLRRCLHDDSYRPYLPETQQRRLLRAALG